MFFHITYGTRPWMKALVAFYSRIKYALLRPLLSDLSWLFYWKKHYRKFEKTAGGQELRNGISVYVPVKNEAAHLEPALESLLGIADQYILLDNGSTDGSLEIMQRFFEQHKQEAEIEIHSVPKLLLVEMVQFALSRVRYSWVLKWDGDMIAINESSGAFAKLKSEVLLRKRPVAYTLPRINLEGDYRHTSLLFSEVDAGEPFLRKFNNAFRFEEEFGRLEHARIPIYYKLLMRKEFFSFHLSYVRPPERLMYRTIYLDWRQVSNTALAEITNRYKNLTDFEHDWKLHNFGSVDSVQVKYRFTRMWAQMCKKLNEQAFPPLPPALLRIIDEGKSRFEVQYRNGKPYIVADKLDVELMNYKPTAEDENWNPDPGKYFTDALRLKFTGLYREAST